MAIFAVGDIQGCYDDLRRLLDRLAFNPVEDHLWLTGDLVNRGRQSLETLRFVRSLGERTVCVLGNHDLHLLAVAAGHAALRPSDTLDEILAAQDRDDLLAWLQSRPLMHHDAELGYTLVHAGLPPQWNLETAQACAHELETVLRGPDADRFFADMYGNQPDRWSADLAGIERLRFIVNCFTRLRFVGPQGQLELKHKGKPGTQPPGYLPWFAVPARANANLHILFGHWSTLGEVSDQNVYALDSGCVWGGKLSALRLDGDDSGGWYSVDCPGAQRPGET